LARRTAVQGHLQPLVSAAGQHQVALVTLLGATCMCARAACMCACAGQAHMHPHPLASVATPTTRTRASRPSITHSRKLRGAPGLPAWSPRYFKTTIIRCARARAARSVCGTGTLARVRAVVEQASAEVGAHACVCASLHRHTHTHSSHALHTRCR
jgi:hypothetical protein